MQASLQKRFFLFDIVLEIANHSDQQQNCVYDKVLYCTKRITGRIYEAPGNVFIDVLQTGRSYRAKNQNTKLYI